jgi:serine/threonine protein kinase
MSISPGTRLGPYEVVAPLGAGGMGEVYRARDPKLGREIAVKVLPSATASDPDRRQRFELEARAASALNHPNILTVYDIGEADGSLAYRHGARRGQDCASSWLRRGSADQKPLTSRPDGRGTAGPCPGIVHRDSSQRT